jgi:hypothetical protein
MPHNIGATLTLVLIELGSPVSTLLYVCILYTFRPHIPKVDKQAEALTENVRKEFSK